MWVVDGIRRLEWEDISLVFFFGNFSYILGFCKVWRFCRKVRIVNDLVEIGLFMELVIKFFFFSVKSFCILCFGSWDRVL